MDLDWGNVPTWLALIAAGVAVTSCTLRRERERDIRREADGRKAQADKVAGWVDQHEVSGPEGPYLIFLRNASELPIYDLKMSVRDTNTGKEIIRKVLPVLAPEAKHKAIKLRAEFVQDDIARAELVAGVNDKQPGCGVTLQFRDGSGTRWRRELDGKLVKVSG